MSKQFYKFILIAVWLVIPLLVMGQAETALTIHVVQRGENLFQIAQQYGVSVDDLAGLNSLADPSDIQVGQRLLVPAVSTNGTPAITHVVQPGETLESIGAFYGLPAADLQALNQLPDGRIYIGQTLVVPAPDSMPTTPVPTNVALSVNPESVTSPSSSSTSIVMHTVAPGETLFRIAQNYGTTINAIAAANSLANTDVIYPGQTLLIPDVQPPAMTSVLPPTVTAFSVTPLVFTEGQTGMFRFNTTEPVNIGGAFLDTLLNVAVDGTATQYTALIGVPLGTPAGIYPATFSVTNASGVSSEVAVQVQVVSGSYFQERDIDIVGNSTVLLDPTIEDAELSRLRSVMSAFTPDHVFLGKFGLPAAATITSSFGNLRSYNDGAVVRVHLGTDFGGVPGTPILAPAAGRVVFAEPLNIRGNATVIEHGWGVYTGYWHQSEQYVNVGDFVQPGQVIGAIGATGRGSGPHLHWELWVNGVPVDPMQWTVQSFS